MLPIPTVADLSRYSGQPAGTYSGYANSALLLATLMLTVKTELTSDEWPGMAADDQVLALNGICAMADYIYLRQPYRQVLASPLMNETVGSYSYGKAMQEMARNAQALEVTSEQTGVVFYDLAIQYLSKRQRAGGVFHGGITLFEDRWDPDDEQIRMEIREEDGRLVIVGPSEINRFDQPLDINSDYGSFPMDP